MNLFEMKGWAFLFLLFTIWSQFVNAQVVKLTWDSNPEENIMHYTVYRDYYSQPEEVYATVPALRTVYYDTSITIGRTYYYRMTATDSANNMSDYSDEVMIVAIPHIDGRVDTLVANSLDIQNYPNPFNPQTMIQFTIPEAGHLNLTVYDILGREVIKLTDEYKNAGKHAIKWNGVDRDGQRVGSGIYFCRLRMSRYSGVLKLIVTR